MTLSQLLFPALHKELAEAKKTINMLLKQCDEFKSSNMSRGGIISKQYMELNTLKTDLDAANRRIASLKGTITKLKKKLA